ATTAASPWATTPTSTPVWATPATHNPQPVGTASDNAGAADQPADTPMPELDDNDPLLDTAQTGRIAIGPRPAPMPTVAPRQVGPVPMPTTPGTYRPVPKPATRTSPSAPA